MPADVGGKRKKKEDEIAEKENRERERKRRLKKQNRNEKGGQSTKTEGETGKASCKEASCQGRMMMRSG